MIIRARVVVTMDGLPIDNGAVAVSGGCIADIGKFPEISARHGGERIVDLSGQALLPGLINAHCHLDYTCLRGKISRRKSFTDWIRAINAEKARLSPEDYVVSISEGFAEAKQFGTTTIANLTAFPELVSRIQAPIRTWWFAELIDARDPTRANEIIDLAVEKLKPAEHWGLAPHAPFTASENVYRRCDEIARREKVLLTTHLAESHEEMSLFRDASGPLYDFLKEIGRDMNDCGEQTPFGQFVGRLRDASLPDWLLVHLNEVLDGDLRALAKQSTKSNVVHCPRSHAYFRHSPFQFEKFRELGFNVCLGTDSLASNEDLSLFAEMRAFQKEFPNVSPEELLKLVTVNSAYALHQENALGKIRSEFLADLIAVPYARSTSVFDELVAFDRPVSWSMIGGQVQNSA
ncbi:MAG TPA: amidohydrolase family protein [Chthoniobacterales bacterium]|nr:amidohydrolase family protein [Chthoniobacterales bacterium]